MFFYIKLSSWVWTGLYPKNTPPVNNSLIRLKGIRLNYTRQVCPWQKRFDKIRDNRLKQCPPTLIQLTCKQTLMRLLKRRMRWQHDYVFLTESESGSTLTFIQANWSDRLRSDGELRLSLSHFQHVLIHLELWRLYNQHKSHKHVPRLWEQEMCNVHHAFA